MKRAVIYINTPAITGGAEISLLTLMQHLDRDRYVPLLVTAGEGQLAEQARQQGVQVLLQEFPWISRRRPWRYPSSIIRLAHTIKKYGPCLVHSNCDHSLRYVASACRLCDMPYVSHVRDFVRGWFEPANIDALNRAAAVVANSQAIAAACIKGGVAPEMLKVIYNPIDIAQFDLARRAGQGSVRDALGLPSDAFIVGIVGQILAAKGHADLLAAAPKVLAERHDAHFAIVGEASGKEAQSFRTQLFQLVAEAGLTGRVHFLGYRHDIPLVMRSLDVLAVPSWSEPFGRVVVEGLATGCLVVGTDAGGIPEIIRNEVNGLLVPVRDHDSLAQAIIRLGQDRVLAAQLRHNGIEMARHFDSDRHSRKMQDLYDLVVNDWRGSKCVHRQ